MRRLFLSLAVAMLGLGLAPSPVRAQAAPPGTINLHLAVPAGTGLTGTHVRLDEQSTSYTRDIDLISGPGPFAIPGLPPASSYSVAVTSQRFGGGVCLGGDASVPVVSNGTTIFFANLTCFTTVPKRAPGLGRHAPVLALLALLIGAVAVSRESRRA